MNLVERLEAYRAEEQQLTWRGTFKEYFEMVLANPDLARLSHARLYDTIMAKGSTTVPSGERSYGFFTAELFGIDRPLEHLVDYFASAARRLEVRKRILLLMGPVGGGKSTIVALLKRGLEEHTCSEEGAIYAIASCPMHEEPLHLLPERLREEVKQEHGLYIEGDLCPACRVGVDDRYGGRIEDVEIRRVAFSEKKRVGIGTFSPSDPKSQDISELTGSIDLATIGEYGVESDPRAYRFDGELNVANRGVMEFVEMLKCDEKFLYNLLTLSQEQSIKTGRFAMIYADEVIVSHTNEHEYSSFIANKKSEALHDRIILIKVPYNLRVSDEIKIYEKLINQGNLAGVHIAPNTLRVASTFAVLSRLEQSKKAGMNLLKKLKLYDGEEVDDFGQKDLREVQEESPREGMEGISPRYVINALSAALVRENTTCINPIDGLRALRDGLERHPGYDRERREQLLNLIGETRREYDELAKKEVQKAFVYSFEQSAKTLLDNYLDNVEAFCNKSKLRDPITDEEVDPDEQLMRSVEEQIGISENAKKAFREEILIRLSSLARRGQSFAYTSHERLREAIEKKLFADLKDVVKITTSTKTPDAEQLRRINEVVDRLIAEQCYCPVCANELVKYVGALLSR
ncbi:MAG TPA: protein prkA [Chloroflexota bacterium]|nr:protein prkA [Chloroflexota bacterium]